MTRARNILLAAVLAVACGGEEATGPEPAAGPRESTTGELAPSAPGAPAQPPPLARMQVEVTGQRATILARAAPRAALLVLLCGKAGVELEVRALSPRRVTLELRDVPLEEAVAQLLDDVPYGLDYALDPKRGGHLLARVRVGEGAASLAGATPGPADPREPEPAPAVREARPDWRVGSESDREAERQEFGRRLHELVEHRAEEKRIAREADRADPERAAIAARLDAVEETEPEGSGLGTLIETLENDPSPEVRAAAAEQLSMTETPEAVRGLLRGLDDPVPAVVIAVLDALVVAGDERIVPRVRRLLRHSDPEVRDEAQLTIDFLE